jgi:hypothetical protein
MACRSDTAARSATAVQRSRYNAAPRHKAAQPRSASAPAYSQAKSAGRPTPVVEAIAATVSSANVRGDCDRSSAASRGKSAGFIRCIAAGT